MTEKSKTSDFKAVMQTAMPVPVPLASATDSPSEGAGMPVPSMGSTVSSNEGDRQWRSPIE